MPQGQLSRSRLPMRKQIRLVVLYSMKSILSFVINFILIFVLNTQCMKTLVVELPTWKLPQMTLLWCQSQSASYPYSIRAVVKYLDVKVRMHSGTIGVLCWFFSNTDSHKIVILNKSDPSFSTTFASGSLEGYMRNDLMATLFISH